MNYQRFLVDENLSDNFFLKGEADKLCNVRSANHRTKRKFNIGILKIIYSQGLPCKLKILTEYYLDDGSLLDLDSLLAFLFFFFFFFLSYSLSLSLSLESKNETFIKLILRIDN